MTPARLRQCRERLRWSQADLAAECRASDRTVRRWEEVGAPAAVGQWLEALCDAHSRLPPPVWKQNAFDRS